MYLFHHAGALKQLHLTGSLLVKTSFCGRSKVHCNKGTPVIFSHHRLVKVDAVGKINDLKPEKSLLDVAQTADRAHCWARPGQAAVR